MDPLDPLTEIIRTGQAFSPLIFIERLIWLFIGLFFLGALSTGIKNVKSDQTFLDNKSFFFGLNKKNNKKNNSSSKDNDENISKN